MRTFGSTTSDVVVSLRICTPLPGSPLLVFTAPGGTRITAVLDLNGNLLPDGVVTAETNGQFAFRIDDDSLDTVWVQDENANWYLCIAHESITEAASAARELEQIRDMLTQAQTLWTTPLDHGATGNGITDDTDAFYAAMDTGLPVQLGGRNRVYRITRSLLLNLTRDTTWLGFGAQIRLDSPAPIQHMFEVQHNQFGFAMVGRITLDAARNAYRTMFCNNNNATKVSLLLERIDCLNAYRSGTAFAGGDGMFIQGNYDQIRIVRPRIRNVTMAAGAATAGIQGVTGITVKAASLTASFDKVELMAPLIENVYSEDLAYTSDQDGFRIMAAEDVPDVPIPYDSNFVVTGYTARNCMGRALKSQTEFGYITDTMIIRDRNRGLTQGVGTDIDFQVGGGQIKGVYAKYVNDAPNLVVSLSGPATASKIVPHPICKDVRVVTTGGTFVMFVIQKGFRAENTSVTEIANIETVGTQPNGFLNINGVAGGHHDIFIDQVLCAPTLAGGSQGFIRAAVDGWSGHIYLKRIKNMGAGPMVLIGTPTPNAITGVQISGEDLVGFNDNQPALNASRNLDGVITRRNAIGPTNTLIAGVERFCAQTIAAGATWKLPASFLTNFTGMILASVDGDIEGQGLFRVNQAQVLAMFAGTGWSVGTTSEPAAGNYRMWTSATGVTVSNRTGASRTFTFFMFG